MRGRTASSPSSLLVHKLVLVALLWGMCISSSFGKLRFLGGSRLFSGHKLRTESSSSFGNNVQSLLICGPSGVGKGTLIGQLLKDFPHSVALSVSRTSRAPREGEIDGVHYYFVNRDVLKKDITEGSIPYLEHAEVHGNLYGTRLDAVHNIHKQGKLCLLDLDTRGAQQLKAMKFPIHSIFVSPPSIETLQSRLLQRGSETAEQQKIRLENARAEIAYGTQSGNFHWVLVNDNLEECYARLVQHLQHIFPKHFSSQK